MTPTRLRQLEETHRSPGGLRTGHVYLARHGQVGRRRRSARFARLKRPLDSYGDVSPPELEGTAGDLVDFRVSPPARFAHDACGRCGRRSRRVSATTI